MKKIATEEVVKRVDCILDTLSKVINEEVRMKRSVRSRRGIGVQTDVERGVSKGRAAQQHETRKTIMQDEN